MLTGAPLSEALLLSGSLCPGATVTFSRVTTTHNSKKAWRGVDGDGDAHWLTLTQTGERVTGTWTVPGGALVLESGRFVYPTLQMSIRDWELDGSCSYQGSMSREDDGLISGTARCEFDGFLPWTATLQLSRQ